MSDVAAPVAAARYVSMLVDASPPDFTTTCGIRAGGTGPPEGGLGAAICCAAGKWMVRRGMIQAPDGPCR